MAAEFAVALLTSLNDALTSVPLGDPFISVEQQQVCQDYFCDQSGPSYRGLPLVDSGLCQRGPRVGGGAGGDVFAGQLLGAYPCAIKTSKAQQAYLAHADALQWGPAAMAEENRVRMGLVCVLRVLNPMASQLLLVSLVAAAEHCLEAGL